MIITHTITGEKVVIEDYPEVFIPPHEFSYDPLDEPITEEDCKDVKKYINVCESGE